MIDNIKLIKPLLNFEEEGDFYFLSIMKRKKDQPENEKDNHQSVRIIRSYCIKSIEQLEKRYNEIITLCEVFKARCYIHLNRQNHKDLSLEMMITLAQRIKGNQYEQQGLFDSIVGQARTYEKRWVVDVDTKDEETTSGILKIINEIQPGGDNKVEATIPTKNGYHFITKKFDVNEFRKHYPEVDIQKKNPTLLFYPNSLDK